MALKGDRFEAITSIKFFMNEVAERGGVVVSSTGAGVNGGSGAALDQWKSQVTYADDASGRYPVGLLLNDMVNLDLTKQHMNLHKNQMQIGSKVTLLREGWVVTDMLVPGDTPALGSGAYLGASGLLTTSSDSGQPQVGEFESAVDADGFCTVYVKLPQ